MCQTKRAAAPDGPYNTFFLTPWLVGYKMDLLHLVRCENSAHQLNHVKSWQNGLVNVQPQKTRIFHMVRFPLALSVAEWYLFFLFWSAYELRRLIVCLVPRIWRWWSLDYKCRQRITPPFWHKMIQFYLWAYFTLLMWFNYSVYKVRLRGALFVKKLSLYLPRGC